MKNFFGKVKELLKQATASQKKNVLFMAVEVLLIMMIVGGVVAGMVLAHQGVEPDPSSMTTVDGTSSEEVASIEVASGSVSTASVPDETVTVESEVAITRQVDVSEPDMTDITNWSEDQFLPVLPEAASKLDYFVSSKLTNEELLMFTSLKGIVNKSQPRIYTCETEPTNTYNSWLEKMDIKLNRVENPYTLISKYIKELSGVVIYDDTDIQTSSTINLATTIAGTKSALIVSPGLYKKIHKYYPELKIIDNLKARKFQDKWEIYDYMYDNYLAGTSKRILCGINPDGIYGLVRDYAIAVQANVVFLDPEATADADILAKYLKRMIPGKSAFMGWWHQENSGVNFGSMFGVYTLAADTSCNLSVYAGMNKKFPVKQQKTAKKPKLRNKLYVALSIADGDNLQYCERFLFGIWNQPERGQMPISWTMTPSLADIGKPMLDYYNRTATKNDYIISGPSAYGYFYPKFWYHNQMNAEIKASFPKFLQQCNKYFEKLGWRSITVWNWETGGMSKDQMQVYADNMPYLLGFTQQEHSAKPVYLLKSKGRKTGNKHMLGMKLDGAYLDQMFQLKQFGKEAIDKFKGTRPEFLTLEAVPWQIGSKISNMLEVKKSMEMLSSDVEFVRMDEYLQLRLEYEQSKK